MLVYQYTRKSGDRPQTLLSRHSGGLMQRQHIPVVSVLACWLVHALRLSCFCSFLLASAINLIGVRRARTGHNLTHEKTFQHRFSNGVLLLLFGSGCANSQP